MFMLLFVKLKDFHSGTEGRPGCKISRITMKTIFGLVGTFLMHSILLDFINVYSQVGFYVFCPIA